MAVSQPAPSRGERIVVVSPHLDDGVLSLGASMSSWARHGAAVELLTVLACDPASKAPTGGWDARGGFATEGESALARREEDRQACAVLGASPVWLPYGSGDYELHGAETAVRDAVLRALEGAGEELRKPGVVGVAEGEARDEDAGGALGRWRVGRYAEQPYTRRAGSDPADAGFARAPARLDDRIAKWRAIRCYASQLPLLAMRGSLRRGPHRYAATPEWIAWDSDYPSTSA